MDIAEVIEDELDALFGLSGKFVNVTCMGNFSKQSSKIEMDRYLFICLFSRKMIDCVVSQLVRSSLEDMSEDRSAAAADILRHTNPGALHLRGSGFTA